MSNVVDIFAHRPKPRERSLTEAITLIADDVLTGWEKHARNNKLHEFFMSQVPSHCKSTSIQLVDLNLISGIEQKLNMRTQITSPEFQSENNLGWIAGFRFNDLTYESPPMVNEAYARCFAILMFLKMKREL